MRKLSLTMLGAVLLILSCQKNGKIETDITEEDETTAEPARKCAAQEVLEEQMRTDPQRAKNLEELERKTADFKGRDQSQFRTAGKLYIPVVVNVVLSNSARVTDAQIQSQLDVL